MAHHAEIVVRENFLAFPHLKQNLLSQSVLGAAHSEKCPVLIDRPREVPEIMEGVLNRTGYKIRDVKYVSSRRECVRSTRH